VEAGYEWDEDKRLLNIKKHGIDFVDAVGLFEQKRIYSYRAPRNEEERCVTIGMIGQQYVAVGWTRRSDTLRVISARSARNAEKRQYRALFG
jgi:uncharacterized DUF497 family protein